MKRLLVLVGATLAALALPFAQPVEAIPGGGPSIGTQVTATVNQLLGATPVPEGWQPRHVCTGIDTINWGECITVPFPS